jgi:hypothetical protein
VIPLTRSTSKSGKLTAVQLHYMDLPNITLDDALECNQGTLKPLLSAPSCAGAWTGGIETIDDARALFFAGWADGAARAEAMRKYVDGLIPAGTVARRTRCTSDDGEELRIDAVLAGDWDNAYTSRTTRQQRSDSVISLSTGWVAPASIPHERLIWNAVQMIVLADALEEAGWRVEVRAIDAGITSGVTQLIDMTIKSAEEPLRADAIAAVVGHAGVFRTLGFHAICLSPKEVGSHLGTATQGDQLARAVEKAVTEGMLPSVSLCIPRADSLDQCRKNILEAVASLFPDTGD